MKNNETFEYTYSATQQAEIDKIRKKYMPKEEDKMEQLRKLDKSVTKAGTMYSVSIGVIGCLVLGIGMCFAMVWNTSMIMFVAGIVIGILGIAVIAAAYPVYMKITAAERERIAPQILALTEELSR